MDADRYYFGFAERILDGAITFDVTDDGNANAYTISPASGDEFYHGALDDSGGTPAGTYEGFATWLKTQLDAASGTTWTITFSNSALTYTVTNDSGSNIAVTLSTWAQRILGFTASLSGATSYTSTVRPWFVIAPNVDCVSGLTEREPRGVFLESVTDGGRGYMVGPTTVLEEYQWTQQHETHAATRKEAASASVPFTWGHAFGICRGYVRFLLVDSTSASITYASDVVGRFEMTADGSVFAAKRSDRRTNQYWEIPIRARCIERVKS